MKLAVGDPFEASAAAFIFENSNSIFVGYDFPICGADKHPLNVTSRRSAINFIK